jgi:hypothetical protein
MATKTNHPKRLVVIKGGFLVKKTIEEILEKMTDDGHGVLAVPGTEEERKDMDHLMKEFIKKDKKKKLRSIKNKKY